MEFRHCYFNHLYINVQLKKNQLSRGCSLATVPFSTRRSYISVPCPAILLQAVTDLYLPERVSISHQFLFIFNCTCVKCSLVFLYRGTFRFRQICALLEYVISVTYASRPVFFLFFVCFCFYFWVRSWQCNDGIIRLSSGFMPTSRLFSFTLLLYII